MKVTKKLEDEYYKGLLYESQIPEVITRGHAVNASRKALIQERAEFSNYPMLPTKYPFQRTVRIYTMVMAFVSKTRRNKKLVGALLMEGELTFSVFNCQVPGLTETTKCLRLVQKQTSTDDQCSAPLVPLLVPLDTGYKKTFNQIQVDRMLQPTVDTDKYINLALKFLYRKGTAEVKEFNSAEVIRKHMVEMDGILLSKNRMVAELDYTHTSELNLNLGSLGIKFQSPCLDRHSPLSYSIGQYIHWKLAPHRGMETHNRISLEHVHIMQGMSLYRELSQECIRCNMRRKKFLEVRMGGVKPEQLIVAPPFWTCQIDLFGPYRTFVPGHEKQTRNKQMLECQVWVLAVVCPTTRLVNLQVVEKSDAGGIICGITRLACEGGMPKYMFIDQDSAIISALSNAEVQIRDVQQQVHREFGIVFTVCPVGGHSQHGQVERVIRSLQQSLDDCGLKKERLHATGLQTLCKIVENAYNSLPIGYSYDRDQDNTQILKIICPNMLKMGHKNQRQLEGPIRLARGTRELLVKVEKLYEAWFNVWRDTVVPKIMFRPKWYNSDKDLEEGDLVYFQKKDGKIDTPWTIGMVEQVVKSDRDDLIRKVVVKYQNYGEDHPQYTDRHVRKLVKLFNVDEHQVQEDLDDLQKKIDSLERRPLNIDDIAIDDDQDSVEDEVQGVGQIDGQPEVDLDQGDDAGNAASNGLDINDVELQESDADSEADGLQGDEPQPGADVPAKNTRSRRGPCNCCCGSHCKLSFHTIGEPRSFNFLKNQPVPCDLQPVNFENLYKEDCCSDHVENESTSEVNEDDDTLTSVLMSLNLKM